MIKEWTIKELLEVTKKYFIQKKVSEPRLSSELLLAEILDLKRLDLYLKFDKLVSENELCKYRNLVKERIKGVPIQYLINRAEFFGLSFNINDKVLIPRPETEFIVEKSIDFLKARKGGILIDIGTGCGAIGIASSYYVNDVEVIFSDISKDAMEITKENAERLLGVDRKYSFNTGNLFEGIKVKGDIVTANLPYLNREQMENLQLEVTYEPGFALEGGEDGLDIIKTFIDSIGDYINKRGKVMIEFDDSGKEMLESYINEKGLENTFYKDYNNLYRYCVINF